MLNIHAYCSCFTIYFTESCLCPSCLSLSLHSIHVPLADKKLLLWSVLLKFACHPCAVGKIWNSLPNDVVTAKSIDAFKRRLDKNWKDRPLIYDHTADLEDQCLKFIATSIWGTFQDLKCFHCLKGMILFPLCHDVYVLRWLNYQANNRLKQVLIIRLLCYFLIGNTDFHI